MPFPQSLLHSFLDFALDEVQLKKPEEIKCILKPLYSTILIKTRFIVVPRLEHTDFIQTSTHLQWNAMKTACLVSDRRVCAVHGLSGRVRDSCVRALWPRSFSEHIEQLCNTPGPKPSFLPPTAWMEAAIHQNKQGWEWAVSLPVCLGGVRGGTSAYWHQQGQVDHCGCTQKAPLHPPIPKHTRPFVQPVRHWGVCGLGARLTFRTLCSFPASLHESPLLLRIHCQVHYSHRRNTYLLNR